MMGPEWGSHVAKGAGPLFLKRMGTKSGRVKLAIYESYWDAEAGRSRQRSVEALGFVDELEAEHDDPVAWARGVVERMNAEREAQSQAVQIEIHPLQRVDMRSANRRNAGSAIAMAVYGGLGIEAVLRNHSRGRRHGYDLNAVTRLLVVERIVEPGSKRAAWERRDRHFLRSEFSDDDVYRALDELAACNDRICAAMNRSIAKTGVRDMSHACYFITDHCFECDPDEGDEGPRKKGVSKEHRPNPIVQMGLLQDRDGVPIAHRVFDGNTSDCVTMIPVLAKMKATHGIECVVAVADKGLNCSDNIAALVARGDGFVFSQSLRGTKSTAAMKRWAMSDEGWDVRDGFRMKSRQGYKTLHIKAEDTADGTARDVECEVKWVAMWSEKYERRARHQREKVLERARDLVAHPGNYTRQTHYGAAAYVKDLHFDDDGNVAENCELSIDEEAIKEAEKYDGYYLIVTSETGWDDELVLDTYRELWRIEQTFWVSKSDIESRSAFVRSREHIEAHFLTCYIALTILRLLQRATGIPASAVREELSLMCCTSLESNWWIFDHRTEESDLLADAVGLPELKRKYLTTGDMRSILGKAKKSGIPQAKRS